MIKHVSVVSLERMSLLFPSPSVHAAWLPALSPWPILLTALVDVIMIMDDREIPLALILAIVPVVSLALGLWPIPFTGIIDIFIKV